MNKNIKLLGSALCLCVLFAQQEIIPQEWYLRSGLGTAIGWVREHSTRPLLGRFRTAGGWLGERFPGAVGYAQQFSQYVPNWLKREGAKETLALAAAAASMGYLGTVGYRMWSSPIRGLSDSVLKTIKKLCKISDLPRRIAGGFLTFERLIDVEIEIFRPWITGPEFELSIKSESELKNAFYALRDVFEGLRTEVIAKLVETELARREYFYINPLRYTPFM